MILDALKKRLYQKEEKHPGRWLKELPAVVWGLRTQSSRSTSVSPYFLVYSSEAILPADVAFRAPRVENYVEEQAVAIRTEDIDRTKEERLITYVCTAKYLEDLRRYYNRNHSPRHSFIAVVCCYLPNNRRFLRNLSRLSNRYYKAVTLIFFANV